MYSMMLTLTNSFQEHLSLICRFCVWYSHTKLSAVPVGALTFIATASWVLVPGAQKLSSVLNAAYSSLTGMFSLEK